MAAEYEYVPIVYSINKKKAEMQKEQAYRNGREYVHKRESIRSMVYDLKKKPRPASRQNVGYSYKKAERGRFDHGIVADMRSAGTAAYSSAHYTENIDSSVAGKKENQFFLQKGVVSTILLIMAVFAMLSLVLAGNTQISSINFENAALESEISALEQEIEDIKLDITLGEDLEYLQKRAAELGMSSPRADQIVYVSETSGAEDAASFDVIG